VPDVINPFVVAENPQGLSNRLVDAAGTNFNRMFKLLEIETGHFARLRATTTIYHGSLFLRQQSNEVLGSEIKSQDRYKRKSGRLKGGGSLLNARFFKQSDRKGGVCKRTI
jgi:hypothetical protein